MNFLKNLFAPKQHVNPEEKEQQERQRRLQIFKDDGVRALKMHEYPTAVQLLSQAMTLATDDADVWRWLSEAYLATGDLDKAIPLLRKLSEREPDNLSVLLALAQVAANLKQWAIMTETLQKAYLIDDKNAQIYYLEAVACHGQGDEVTAEADLTRALQLDSSLGAAYRLRADVLMAQNRPDEAEKDLDLLLKNHAEADELWVAKGDACRAQHKTSEAAEAYKHAREANPFNQTSVLRLSSLLSENGQTQQAIETLTQAIEEQPDFAEAYRERGRLKLTLGDEVGARADEAKALEINPQFGKSDSNEYANLENRVEDKLRAQNPFGF